MNRRRSERRVRALAGLQIMILMLVLPLRLPAQDCGSLPGPTAGGTEAGAGASAGAGSASGAGAGAGAAAASDAVTAGEALRGVFPPLPMDSHDPSGIQYETWWDFWGPSGSSSDPLIPLEQSPVQSCPSPLQGPGATTMSDFWTAPTQFAPPHPMPPQGGPVAAGPRPVGAGGGAGAGAGAAPPPASPPVRDLELERVMAKAYAALDELRKRGEAWEEAERKAAAAARHAERVQDFVTGVTIGAGLVIICFLVGFC